MSTIASPRDSSSIRSPSSSRTSLDLPAAPRPQPGSQRRNRTALRDYYNLKATPSQSDSQPSPNELDPQDTTHTALPTSELDKPGFDAASHVKTILASQPLDVVLRTEAGLISEIKNLDGERKALVYDNYSKLIAATDTIRRMRTNMDPLTPATSTLAPAVAHIAETAKGLSRQLGERTRGAQRGGEVVGEEEGRMAQKQTVRWVLDTPRRVKEALDAGDRTAAVAEYGGVQPLLERWRDVPGSVELKARCEKLLAED